MRKIIIGFLIATCLVMAVCMIPIFVLNTVGVVASVLWLGWLGRWGAVFLGALAIFVAPLLWMAAISPAVRLIAYAARAEWMFSTPKRVIVVSCANIYLLALLGSWFFVCLEYVAPRAKDASFIPMLVLSYSIATSPFNFIALRAKGEEREQKSVVLFFACIAYISASVWRVYGSPTWPNLFLIIGVLFAVAELVNAATKRVGISGQRRL
jgi:hypothetical protein